MVGSFGVTSDSCFVKCNKIMVEYNGISCDPGLDGDIRMVIRYSVTDLDPETGL